ncbi:flavin reductase family protein [Streptomyces coelicoflavus]|uniref:Flavin reductase family protein n=1 Tax=Streptomyces salyersiae TaxID=3075530 RepID=A0ABU2REG9_9ACTN|nr:MULTISPECIES: flavin reductase family protein [unclassified Streptomyces]MCT7350615.1 flavin reductase family protein [Streptomyces sp. 15-116A]MCW1097637.1 flavin reductase family protein [Streptomyces sp. RS2]MDT0427268.1 flavin reductase family protein [Streptomyces sp. DSM 41770]WDI21512.1 flavin reductase family protein [Streptomyces enissocaesilis]
MTGALSTAALPPQTTASPVTERGFKDVLAHLPSGVTVLTTSGPDGAGAAGMTASAVCSLSLDPPMILACAANHSRTLARIRTTGVLAVNVLREDQVPLARRFADPHLDQDARFAATAHRLEDGLPVLHDALAWLTCTVQAAHPGGDHTILTAEVRRLGLGGGHPLLWHNRTFRILA